MLKPCGSASSHERASTKLYKRSRRLVRRPPVYHILIFFSSILPVEIYQKYTQVQRDNIPATSLRATHSRQLSRNATHAAHIFNPLLLPRFALYFCPRPEMVDPSPAYGPALNLVAVTASSRAATRRPKQHQPLKSSRKGVEETAKGKRQQA